MRSEAAITALICSSIGVAQTPPAAADPADPAEAAAPADETILIVADPEARTSLDRTTYVVKDNAEARSSSTLELLSKVPFVDSTPDGEIRLMGNSGVKILIDGQEVSDPATTLGNLQGSQVAKIEVITNPSAQFSAEGTAGVINIVTRRSVSSGLGGSVTASASSHGAFDLKLSPTWSRGRLSLSGSFNYAHHSLPLRYRRERRYDGPGGGKAEDSEDSIETGILGGVGNSGNANLVLSYKPDSRRSLSVTAFILASDHDFTSEAEVRTGTGFLDFTQTRAGETNLVSRAVTAEYQQDGVRKGEKLTVSAKSSRSVIQSETLFATTRPPTETEYFPITTDNLHSFASLKLDYIRPFGKNRRLSLGGLLQHTRSDQLTEYGEGPSPGGGGPEGSADLRSAWLEKSAYATYETPLLGGVVQGGLRLESRRYELVEEAQFSPPGRTEAFPSLHFERKLAKALTANLSYSRRVAWPGVSDLDPRLRFSDPTTASRGNPDLRPEITNAFEGKLGLGLSAHSIDVTAFFRRSGNVWTDSIEREGNGVLVKRMVNAGTRTSRGVSLSASGPIARRLRYSLNGDLADQEYRGIEPSFALDADGVDYGGSVEIEYRDGTEGKPGADRIALDASYRAPSRSPLSRSSFSPSVGASWSHVLTERLTGIVKADALLGAQRFRTAHFSGSGYSREVTRIPGPRVTFSLTYDLRQRSAR